MSAINTLQRAPELTCGRLRCPMATTTPPSAIPGAVWMSPTPTPLILRVRDLRLVERSILSRPRATSSQLGLWLRQQSREDTAPNPRSARGTRGTSRTYARRLAGLLGLLGLP